MSAPSNAADLDTLVESILAKAGLADVATRLRERQTVRERLMNRATIAAVFDREIYERFIAVGDNADGWPFNAFIKEPNVEAVPRMDGFFQLNSAAMDREIEVTPELREANGLCPALLNEWRQRVGSGADRVWLLPHLWVEGEEALLDEVSRQIDAALNGPALDLDRADFVWRIFSEHAWWTSVATSGFEEMARKIQRRIDTRRRFAGDHYKSARYYRREKLHWQLNSFFQGTEKTPWILPIYAAGGIGKTIFLRHVFTHEWLRDDWLVARIDFDHVAYHHLAAAPWLLLLPLAEQWALQLGEDSLKLTMNRADEWRRFLLPAGAPGAALAGEDPPGPRLGKTWEETLELETDNVVRALPENRRCVIVLDTTEEPYLHPPGAGKLPLQAVLQVLAYLHSERPELRLILAGRYDLFGTKQPENTERIPGMAKEYSGQAVPSLEIKGFDQEETTDFFQKCHGLQVTDEVAQAVFVRSRDAETGRALPFDLDLWARWLRDEPNLTASEILKKENLGLHYLVERVLKRIPDNDVRWMVRYSVVPRRLTLEFVREVIWPAVRQQSALLSATENRADRPNESLRQQGMEPVFLEGLTLKATEKDLSNLWKRLLRYASGPEEGWLNPDAESGQFRLHPRVIQPMRAELEKQPVWAELHAAAERDFEAKATRAVGSASWCSFMSEALFHACHRGAEVGEARWKKLAGMLKPRDWAALGMLAEMVLGEAGFEEGEGASRPLLGITGERQVSLVLEEKAAFAKMLAALWRWVLVEDAAEREKSVAPLIAAMQRWLSCPGAAGHPQRGFIETFAARAGARLQKKELLPPKFLGELLRNERATRDPERVLLALVRARLAELSGDFDSALAILDELSAGPLLRNARFAPIPRVQVRQLRTLLQVQHSPRLDHAAMALEKLLAETDLSPKEKPGLRLQAAELWLLCAQPKRTLRLVTTGFRSGSVEPVVRIRARILEAQALVTLGQWVKLARILDDAEKQLHNSDDHVLQVLRLELTALRAQQAAALAEFGRAAELERTAAEGYASLGGDFANAANRVEVQRAYSLYFQQGNRHEAIGVLAHLDDRRAESQVRVDLGDVTANAMLREIEIAMSRPLGSSQPTIADYFSQLRASMQESSGAEHLARLAQLVAAGEAPVADLLTLLAKVEPPSLRVPPLRWLAGAPTGKRRPSDPKIGRLFAKAFPNPTLPPRGVGIGELYVAELHRVCGSPATAAKLIDQVARAAARRRDTWLWWQAAEAADRLGRPLRTPLSKPTARSALYVVLRLRDLEHALGSVKKVNATLLKQWLKELEKISKHLDVGLERTQYAARRFEIEARLAALCDEVGLPITAWPQPTREASLRETANSRRAAARTLWKDLGQSDRVEATILSKSLTSPKPPETKAAKLKTPTKVEWDVASIDLRAAPHLTYRKHAKDWKIPASFKRLCVNPTSVSKLNFERALEAWSETPKNLADALTGMLLPGLSEARKREARFASLALRSTPFGALPWELADLPELPLLFRCSDDRRVSVTKMTRWLQDVLRLHGHRVVHDGILGPATTAALRQVLPDVQFEMGALIAALRQQTTPPTTPSPLCVLETTSATGTKTRGLSIRSGRNVRAEVEPHYVKTGVLRESGEARPAKPSIHGLNQLTSKRPPRLWHFFCPMVESANSTFRRLAWHEPLSTTAIIDIVKRASVSPSAKPVVLLDIIVPANSDYEQRRSIMQRNHFAADLWECGLFSGIIATCWDGARPLTDDAPRLAAIADSAARRQSLHEVTTMLRNARWGIFANTTALWTHHPEVPFFW